MAMIKGCSTCGGGKLSSGNLFQTIGTYINDAITAFGQARTAATGTTPVEGISSITLSSALPVIAIGGAIFYIIYKAKK